MTINRISFTQLEPGKYRIWLDHKNEKTGRTFNQAVAVVSHETDQIIRAHLDVAQEYLNSKRRMTLTQFKWIMEPCTVEAPSYQKGGQV